MNELQKGYVPLMMGRATEMRVSEYEPVSDEAQEGAMQRILWAADHYHRQALLAAERAMRNEARAVQSMLGKHA